MHLAVFDIDGTLVDSDEFDGLLYAEAIRTVLGQEIDFTWSSYSNVTDSGILDEIIDESDVPGDRSEIHTRVRDEFLRLTRNYIARNSGPLQEIPGARSLIDALRSHPSVALAIATGGWRETAELKLRGIGIDPSEIPLATASDASDRRTIIALAEDRALNAESAERCTYFGDGAWDKEAAAALDYEFVAIGNRVVHDVVLPDLTDHATIFRYLGI